MKRRVIKTRVLCFLFLGSKNLIAQKKMHNKIDTLRFKSIGNVSDTFYSIREKLNGNTYKETIFYGLSDNSNLRTSIDTVVINNLIWKKVYNNELINFLSIKDFEDKSKTNEYLSREKKEIFYKEYEPVKKIKVKKKIFYLYKVTPMSGKGMVESLGEGSYHIIFDFTIGEVYRSSYHIKKVLVGYERYVKYFKW